MTDSELSGISVGMQLSYTNAASWFPRVEMLLRAKDCYKAIVEPTTSETKKAKALYIISRNVGDDNLHLFTPGGSPQEIWEKLQQQFQGVSTSRKVHLSGALSSLKKTSDEGLEDFITRCSLLKLELSSAKVYDAEQFRIKFLEALKLEFPGWVLSMRTQQVLPEFDVMIDNLRSVYYDQLHSESVPSSVPGAFNTDVQSGKSVCQYCHKPGHHILRCFKLRKDQERETNQRSSAGGRQGRGGRRGRGRGGQSGGTHNVSAFATAVAGRASGSVQGSSEEWLLDSGSTDNMVNDVALLHNVRQISSTCNLAANNSSVPVRAVGDVKLINHLGKDVTLRDTLFVPELNCNLISLSRADDAGLRVYGKAGSLTIANDSRTLLRAQKRGHLFYAECTPKKSEVPPAQTQSVASPGVPSATSSVASESAMMWHRRLGHTGFSTLANMSGKVIVSGLPSASMFTDELKSTAVCAPCAGAKAQRKPFPVSETRVDKVFDRIHVDIAGPFATSAGGARYYTVIVDEFTNFKVVHTHSTKGDSGGMVEDSILKLQRKYKTPIRALRCDRDAVFLSKQFQAFLATQGIAFEPTSGYSPQENGHAERAIRTLNETRDALLADSGLAAKFWGDALMHGCYLKNLCSSTAKASPWELLTGSKPDVSSLKIFGCNVFVRIPAEKRRKRDLPLKAQAGKFLGFAHPNRKAYRVLLSSGKVVISRDVQFDESAPPALKLVPDYGDLVVAVPNAPPVAPPLPTSSLPAAPAQPQTTGPSTDPSSTPSMSDNPLFDEEAAEDEVQSGAIPSVASRYPMRERHPPTTAYDKYLKSGAITKKVHFRL